MHSLHGITMSAKIVVFVLIQLSFGLRIEEVNFPSHVMLGQTVTLKCEYSIGPSEFIDSIKWYKDNQEFYRIIFNHNIHEDKVDIFDRPGIRLNRDQSGVSIAYIVG